MNRTLRLAFLVLQLTVYGNSIAGLKENCFSTEDSMPFKTAYLACSALMEDPDFSKAQQAKMAIRAGVLNMMMGGEGWNSIGLYLKAVDKGDVSGYSYVAYMYTSGRNGIEINYKKAKEYYDRDTSLSTEWLKGVANLYLNGYGVEQDTAKALMLYITWHTMESDSFSASLICDVFKDKTYNAIDLLKAQMWCKRSASLETMPFLRFRIEEELLTIQKQLTPKELKQSDQQMKKCVASKNYSGCY